MAPVSQEWRYVAEHLQRGHCLKRWRWTLQSATHTRITGHLLRKAAGKAQSWPKRETMCAICSKTQGQSYPSPLKPRHSKDWSKHIHSICLASGTWWICLGFSYLFCCMLQTEGLTLWSMRMRAGGYFGCHPLLPSILVFETEALTEPEVLFQLSWVGSNLPGSACPHTPMRGYRLRQLCPAFKWVLGWIKTQVFLLTQQSLKKRL